MHTNAASELDPAQFDLYELLQVHPKASLETLHRVYRIQAQRYHPDNTETGDPNLFRLVTAAYKVLSEPEARAKYDLQHEAETRQRWRIFSSAEGSLGVEGERSKRQGVLGALYRKRRAEPYAGGVSIFELEDLLGVTREELEFTLWYLRERGCAQRSDNNRYVITAEGIDVLEALESGSGQEQTGFRFGTRARITSGENGDGG